jgi:excisionase family DNA binding protein
MTLLSPKDVAVKYGFSSSQIRRMIREGIIKANKIGNYYIIDEKDVKNLKRRKKLKAN